MGHVLRNTIEEDNLFMMFLLCFFLAKLRLSYGVGYIFYGVKKEKEKKILRMYKTF